VDEIAISVKKTKLGDGKELFITLLINDSNLGF
jgi:hypothetical protein